MIAKTPEGIEYILNYNGIGNMARTVDFKVENNWYTFSMMNSPTGCGLMILYSITGIVCRQHASKRKIVTDAFRSVIKATSGSASAMATLGDSYMTGDAAKNMAETGFVEVSVYSNPAHGQTYKQHLFIFDKLKPICAPTRKSAKTRLAPVLKSSSGETQSLVQKLGALKGSITQGVKTPINTGGI